MRATCSLCDPGTNFNGFHWNEHSSPETSGFQLGCKKVERSTKLYEIYSEPIRWFMPQEKQTGRNLRKDRHLQEKVSGGLHGIEHSRKTELSSKPVRRFTRNF